MKILMVLNGWKDAPHHWWRYLLLPLGKLQRQAGCWVISLFGFAIFFEITEWRP